MTLPRRGCATADPPGTLYSCPIFPFNDTSYMWYLAGTIVVFIVFLHFWRELSLGGTVLGDECESFNRYHAILFKLLMSPQVGSYDFSPVPYLLFGVLTIIGL